MAKKKAFKLPPEVTEKLDTGEYGLIFRFTGNHTRNSSSVKNNDPEKKDLPPREKTTTLPNSLETLSSSSTPVQNQQRSLKRKADCNNTTDTSKKPKKRLESLEKWQAKTAKRLEVKPSSRLRSLVKHQQKMRVKLESMISSMEEHDNQGLSDDDITIDIDAKGLDGMEQDDDNGN